MPKYRPEPERFWEKVARAGEEECWIWQARITTQGYGQFGLSGRTPTYAHRWSYIAHHGEIPKGLVIDHVCHNRKCVNPNHLRAVTVKQNTENHSGPTATNRSGYRGVYFETRTQKWVAQYRHPVHGMMKRFARIEDAAAAVVEHRNQVMTHNDLDRVG